MSPHWPGTHPDELLSAVVDHELEPAVDAAVRAHAVECPSCADSLASVRMARDWIRGMPPADSGPVVETFLARHRRTVHRGAAFVGVVVMAATALALTAAVSHRVVMPEVDAMVAAHLVGLEDLVRADAAESDGPESDGIGIARSGGGSSLRTIVGGGGLDEVESVSGAYSVPPGLIGSGVRLSLQSMFDGEDIAAAVYHDDEVRVSVFLQPGRVDWSALPPGDWRAAGGRRIWMSRAGEGTPMVAVAEVGDLVISVVSDDRAAAMTAMSGLPERHRRSIFDRVHDACQRYTTAFAFGG